LRATSLDVAEHSRKAAVQVATTPTETSPLSADLSGDLENSVAAKLNSKAPSLMTVAEAACALSKSKSTIYRYVDEDKLKWSKVKGRIPTSLVKRLMESE